jgi:glycosyltransferase involved in cell wall biosynthesis
LEEIVSPDRSIHGSKVPSTLVMILPAFPSMERLRGGEYIRPYELAKYLATTNDWRVRILTYRDVTELTTGNGLEVSRISLPQNKTRREVAIFPRIRSAFNKVIDEERSKGSEPFLYAKVPGGVALRGPGFPVHHNIAWSLFSLAAKQSVRTWAMVHDIAPDQDLSNFKRARLSADPWPNGLVNTQLSARLNSVEQKWALRRASFISFTSQTHLDQLSQRCRLAADRTSVFRAGVDESLIPPLHQAKEREGWTIGYIGSQLDADLDLLASAISVIKEPPVRLLIAGERPPLRNSLRLRGDQIEILKGVRYKDFARIASKVDIWCWPSGTDEYLSSIWPLKVPMMAATGAPVVVTDNRELRTTPIRDLMFVAEPTIEGLVRTIRGIIANWVTSLERAKSAKDFVLRHWTWQACISQELNRFAERVIY